MELSIHTVLRKNTFNVLKLSGIIEVFQGRVCSNGHTTKYNPQLCPTGKNATSHLDNQTKQIEHRASYKSQHTFICVGLFEYLIDRARPSVTCDHQRAPRLLAAGRERGREGERERSSCSLPPSSSSSISSSIRLLLPVAAPPTCRY